VAGRCGDDAECGECRESGGNASHGFLLDADDELVPRAALATRFYHLAVIATCDRCAGRSSGIMLADSGMGALM
jgi:hypothetical protein